MKHLQFIWEVLLLPMLSDRNESITKLKFSGYLDYNDCESIEANDFI